MKKFLTILFTLCLRAATALVAPVEIDIYSVNDGTALQLDKFYSVAVNDFLLSGGDGYTSVKGAEIIRESGKDLDVLSTALKKAGQINFDYNNKRLILK